MTKTHVLNLEELFGQRERPEVILSSGKPSYELRLPDELDPVEQLALQKRGERIQELYARYEAGQDAKVMETLAGELAVTFKEWIALLNRDLAAEPLGFFTMMKIITFYRESTGLATGGDKGEGVEGEGSPKEPTGATSSAA